MEYHPSASASERMEEVMAPESNEKMFQMLQQQINHNASQEKLTKNAVINDEFISYETNLGETPVTLDSQSEENGSLEDVSLETENISRDGHRLLSIAPKTDGTSKTENKIFEHQSRTKIMSEDETASESTLRSSLFNFPVYTNDSGSRTVDENYFAETKARTKEMCEILNHCRKFPHDDRLSEPNQCFDTLPTNIGIHYSFSNLKRFNYTRHCHEIDNDTSINSKNLYCNSNNATTNVSKSEFLDSKSQSSYDPVLPRYLKVLLEGAHVCGDSGSPMDRKPEWFNEEKYNRGRQIAINNLFGLVFAEMISLFMILSFSGGLVPLIFTGNSDSPFKAFKRYLSTVIRVRSWYLDDIWQPNSEGNKNIKIVRAMHENVRQQMRSVTPGELARRTTVSGNSGSLCPHRKVWSPLHEEILEDFRGHCPAPMNSLFPPEYSNNKYVFINQMEMAMTQFGFIGLFILYPYRFGAHDITDDDLEAFLHLWRCIGYSLGIEDKYNLCNSNLKTARKRSHDIIHYWVKPHLREVSCDWEHMMRCLVEGVSYYVPGNSFEVALVCLCDIISIQTPRLWSVLTFSQKCTYYLISFVFGVIFRLPGGAQLLNWLVSLSILCAQNLSPYDFINISPARLKALEKKVYPYEFKATCTRL